MAKHGKQKKQQQRTPRPGDRIRYTPAPQEGILVKIWPDGTHQCVQEGDAPGFEAWGDDGDVIEVIGERTDEWTVRALQEIVSALRIRHDHLASRGVDGAVRVDEELLASLEALVGKVDRW